MFLLIDAGQIFSCAFECTFEVLRGVLIVCCQTVVIQVLFFLRFVFFLVFLFEVVEGCCFVLLG